MNRLRLILLGALSAFCAAQASELVLDPCTEPSKWLFINGGEFPGATGKLAGGGDAGTLELDYDFKDGGNYVAAISRMAIPREAETLTLTVRPEQEVRVNLRGVDATGRVFQQHTRRLAAGQAADLELAPDSDWSDMWGGEEGVTARLPWRELYFMVCADPELPSSGRILLTGLTAAGEALSAPPFRGETFEGVLGDVRWQGEWLPAAEGALLKLQVENPGREEVSFAFDFPLNGRPLVHRRTLTQEQAELLLSFPALNPRNIYRVEIEVKVGTKRLSDTLELAGGLADPDRLGRPRAASEIRRARFGTAVHFSYGHDPAGPFKGWHDYQALIDDIALCGMKFIRDNLHIVKDEDTGRWRLSDRDRAWIEYARGKGLEVIGILWMEVNTDIDEFEKICREVGEDTAGLLDIFELGNEPQNFGGWIAEYGGTWNGREADNSTSNWVRAHLEYTNRGAEALRKARPDATIIGTGAVPPTNIRMLRLGLSPAVEGLVEHPYSFSMPPEKIPYSAAHLERDGILTGDAAGTFAGQVNAYADHIRESGIPRGLWLTEYGFSTYWFDAENENKAMYTGYTEEAQAAYHLRRALAILGLPIVKAGIQYDYLDDYDSHPYESEANFGLIRADRSHKPSWQAMRRFNALLAETEPATDAAIAVTAAPLHAGAERGVLVRDWDSAVIEADNSVLALALRNPYEPDERLAVVWNAQPYSRELNNRGVSLRLDGWSDAALPLTAVDLLSGRSFDVEARVEGGAVIIDSLRLTDAPVLLRFDR